MRKMMTWMVVLSVLTAQPAVFAAKQSQDAPELVNVELNQQNELAGQLVDSTGTPIAGKKILVRDQKDPNEAGQVVVSDADGKFTLPQLRSGRVVFDVDKETYACRVWANGTAPPKSLTSISVVPETQTEVVRGQGGGPLNRLRSLTPTQKIILGVLVAAAIVIPIALDDDDDAS